MKGKYKRTPKIREKKQLSSDWQAFFRDFRNDQNGIVLVGVIAISFIIMSSIIWICGALIVNKVFDAVIPYFSVDDTRGLVTAQNTVNTYGVVIVVVDFLLLAWWAISAQRVESVESAGGVAEF